MGEIPILSEKKMEKSQNLAPQSPKFLKNFRFFEKNQVELNIHLPNRLEPSIHATYMLGFVFNFSFSIEWAGNLCPSNLILPIFKKLIQHFIILYLQLFEKIYIMERVVNQGCNRGGVTGLKGGDFLGKIPIFGRKKLEKSQILA